MKSCVLFYVLSAWLRIYFVLGLGVCVFVNGETERENAPSICLHHWDESTAKLQSRLMNRDSEYTLLYGLFTCVSKQTGVWLGGFVCVCMRERDKAQRTIPFWCVRVCENLHVVLHTVDVFWFVTSLPVSIFGYSTEASYVCCSWSWWRHFAPKVKTFRVLLYEADLGAELHNLRPIVSDMQILRDNSGVWKIVAKLAIKHRSCPWWWWWWSLGGCHGNS